MCVCVFVEDENGGEEWGQGGERERERDRKKEISTGRGSRSPSPMWVGIIQYLEGVDG